MSGHSLRVAARAPAPRSRAPSPHPSLTLGPGGLYVHPTAGTIPNFVPPTPRSHTTTATLAHGVTPSTARGYAHPSLGVMSNVTVPVPVTGLLTTVVRQHPPAPAPVTASTASTLPLPNSLAFLAPAPGALNFSVGTGSGSGSAHTVVMGGTASAQPQHQIAQPQCASSMMVPGHTAWYAHTTPPGAHRPQQAAQLVSAQMQQQVALQQNALLRQQQQLQVQNPASPNPVSRTFQTPPQQMNPSQSPPQQQQAQSSPLHHQLQGQK